MKRVLLADDEHASSEIIRFFIQKHKLPLEIVGETTRGDETVREVLRLRPDIVFLDIEMPVLNGLQVMEILQREYKRDLTCIIVTAYDSFSYIQKALRLHAADFLLKPILYEQFCETMERVLGYRYSDNPMFNQLMEYIDLHYAEELKLGDCARALATSDSNVSRLFRQYLDTNFTSYYNSVRIEKAQQLLLRGVAVKEASAQVGYNNLNYFYRIFKAQTGMTPKEYLSGEQAKSAARQL